MRATAATPPALPASACSVCTSRRHSTTAITSAAATPTTAVASAAAIAARKSFPVDDSTR